MAGIQFFRTDVQMEIPKKEALIAGFDGGLVVDIENTKNCKMYLVLNKFKVLKDKKQYKREKRSFWLQ